MSQFFLCKEVKGYKKNFTCITLYENEVIFVINEIVFGKEVG